MVSGHCKQQIKVNLVLVEHVHSAGVACPDPVWSRLQLRFRVLTVFLSVMTFSLRTVLLFDTSCLDINGSVCWVTLMEQCIYSVIQAVVP